MTEAGRLHVGDRLEHRGSPAEFVVVERIGMTNYAVMVSRADGFQFANDAGRMVTITVITDAHRRIVLGRDRDWRLMADDEPPLAAPVVDLSAYRRRRTG